MLQINLSDEYLGAAVQVFKQCEKLVDVQSELTNHELYEPVQHACDQLQEAMTKAKVDHEEVERLAVNACAQLLHFITNYNELEVANEN